MSVTFILNAGIFLIFLCGIVAGWCCHHIWNARHSSLKKCLVLLAGILALTFSPHPAHAQKTWKLISPGPCDTGSGGAADCTTGSIGTPCGDSSIFAGLTGEGERFYVFMVDEIGTFQWKTSYTNTAGTQSETDGFANTYNMNNADHPAARKCATRAPAGTWYLPSKEELNALYHVNGLLKLQGAHLREDGQDYWSSTENGTNPAITQRFDSGIQNSRNKPSSYRVRCIRR